MAEDKDLLIKALNRRGMRAREDENGEVILPLIERNTSVDEIEARNPEVRAYADLATTHPAQDAALFVTTQDMPFPARVGIIGQNSGGGVSYRSDEWYSVTSLDEAVEAFENLWNQRDTFLSSFSGQEES